MKTRWSWVMEVRTQLSSFWGFPNLEWIHSPSSEFPHWLDKTRFVNVREIQLPLKLELLVSKSMQTWQLHIITAGVFTPVVCVCWYELVRFLKLTAPGCSSHLLAEMTPNETCLQEPCENLRTGESSVVLSVCFWLFVSCKTIWKVNSSISRRFSLKVSWGLIFFLTLGGLGQACSELLVARIRFTANTNPSLF